MEKYNHKELTDKIIQAFYNVYNELGYGFLENVYQNALYFELQTEGLLRLSRKKQLMYITKHNLLENIRRI
jgi:GxxExxY protein